MDVVIGDAVCENWALLGVAWCGVATGLALGFVAALAVLSDRGRRWRALRLAEREDRNGRALLEMADEMDVCAFALQGDGLPLHVARRWARLCRRIAADHLASINFLSLYAARPDDPAP